MKNVLLSRPLKAARKAHRASHPRKSLSLGIALPCNGHPITVGGQHTCRKHGPKYSPELLVVTSERFKSNLQQKATQYQRFGAFPRFRMVHLESPNHICLTGCAQTYRLVVFFKSDISMSYKPWWNPQFCAHGCDDNVNQWSLGTPYLNQLYQY